MGDTYRCAFDVDFSGNAGDSQTDTVTASASDDEGNDAAASDDAIVSLTEVAPEISVTKTPSRDVVVAPGGDVTFTITITNETTFEPVTLDSLVDDVYGELDGRGSCVADGSVVIGPGDTYTCRFAARVSGSSGTVYRNTVVATLSDDDPIPTVVGAAAGAEVRIVAPATSLPATDMLPPGSAASAGVAPPTGLYDRMLVLAMALMIVSAAAVIRRRRYEL